MTDLEKQMLNNEYLKILKDPKFSDINVNFLEFWYKLAYTDWANKYVIIKESWGENQLWFLSTTST